MYFNRASREVFIMFSGFGGLCEKLIDINPVYLRPMMRNLKMARAYINKVVTGFMEDLDKDQRDAALRYANDTELSLVPKASPKAGRDYYYVPAEVMERLVQGNLMGCATCLLDGKEAKACQLRRDLLQAGIPAESARECPFRVE